MFSGISADGLNDMITQFEKEEKEEKERKESMTFL
jgi:phage-related minor tail protein